MPETKSHPPRPAWAWYHILLYAAGGLLTFGGAICLALAFSIPEVKGLLGIAVTCVCLASVVVGTTAVHRQGTNVTWSLAVLAYDVGRGVAYAEQAMAMMIRMAALLEHVADGVADDATRAAASELRQSADQQLRQARSEGYVEGVRERLSGTSNVVGWPHQRS